MTIATRIPFLTGSPSLTALTLAAGETALTIGDKVLGALAQVSGGAMGFNIFTPAANATYYLIIRGQDAASGAPANAYIDLVEVTAIAAWVPSWTSRNTAGTPGARTYTNNTGALNVAHANGTTWYQDVTIIRFPA